MGLFRKKQEERAEPLNMVDISELNSIFSTQEITRSQAMEIPTVSACINKIAETVSRLPVRLYRRTNGGISEITDDLRLTLLNCDTGDTLNPVDMWRSIVEDYFLGNGAWLYLNGFGDALKSIHYVDCRNISVMTNIDPIFKSFDIMVNGKKYYDFQFFKLFRKTRTGYSNIPLQKENQKILSVAYNSLKLEDKMNKHGGNKSGFFKLASKASKEAFENIKACCKSLFDNSESTKTFVLNDGLEFQPTSSTPVELQINENKQANSVEICKIFGFPHTVIDGGATEDDNKKFISAVTAILNHIETALDLSFLLEKEKKQGFYFAFDTKELTRGSIKERYEAYEIAVKNHILQIDEVRKEEDFAPTGFNFITMGLGDVLLNPQNMEVFTPNTGQITSLKERNEKNED